LSIADTLSDMTGTGIYARIAGWGACAPKRVVSNAELERLVDTSDEWIRSRSGIETRHIAGPEESTGTIAAAAARHALAMAEVAPADVDMIILATGTPDHPGYPGTASLVQHAIGAPNAAAFDLVAGCSGWLYGLVLATQLVRTGLNRNVLVIGAETLSRFTDWQDRTTCVLFGDAAGAVLIQPSEKPGGLLASVLGSDGSLAHALMIPAGGSRLPTSRKTLEERQHYIKMDGREIFRWAMQKVPEVTLEALRKADLTVADVDLVIPHQANLRILEGVRKRLGMHERQVYVNIQRYGNTSVATIPVALSEAADLGRIKSGDTLCLAAFGAGLTWAVLLWRWNA